MELKEHSFKMKREKASSLVDLDLYSFSVSSGASFCAGERNRYPVGASKAAGTRTQREDQLRRFTGDSNAVE